MEIVHWDAAAEVPWRNGGGFTRELVVAGGDPFEWRLSAATIDRDGPFSEFVGIDRILVLLRGDGVHLDVDDRSITLTCPGQGLGFAGESSTVARLLGGATVDLNLMWRRDRWRASHWFGDLEETPPCASTNSDAVSIVHCVDGEALAGDEVLTTGDTLWWRSLAMPRLEGDAMVVRFCLEPIR